MAAARAALRLQRQSLAANPFLFSGHGLRYRKLEVILTTTIDKLGKTGDVVKVAPGHFRNHLMPKMLAVPNLDKFAILVPEQRKLYQRKEEVVVKQVTKEDDDARARKSGRFISAPTLHTGLDSWSWLRSKQINRGRGHTETEAEHQTNPAGGGRALCFQQREAVPENTTGPHGGEWLDGLGLGLTRVRAVAQ